MAEGENKGKPFYLEDERFKYIGFEVFPGKAGDIFKDENERKSLIDRVKENLTRGFGEVRDRCTLMEERVSAGEKYFLTALAAIVIIALFVPWFSGYIPVKYEEVKVDNNFAMTFIGNTDQESLTALAAHYRGAYANPRELSVAAPKPKGNEPTGGTPGTADKGGANSGAMADSLADSTATANTAAPAQSAEKAVIPDVKIQVKPAVEVLFFDANPQKGWKTPLNPDKKQHLVAYYHFDRDKNIDNLVYGNDAAVRAAEKYFKAPIMDTVAIDTSGGMKSKADSSLAKIEEEIEYRPVHGVVNKSYSMSAIGALARIGGFASKIFSTWEIKYAELSRVPAKHLALVQAPVDDYETLKAISLKYKEEFGKLFKAQYGNKKLHKDSTYIAYVLFFNQQPEGAKWDIPLEEKETDHLVAAYRYDVKGGPDTLVYGREGAMLFGREFIRQPGFELAGMVVANDQEDSTAAEADSTAMAAATSDWKMIPQQSMKVSSGIVVMVSFILFVTFLVGSILIAIYNIYVIFGSKVKDADRYAVELKQKLRLNWAPVLLWLVMFVISFFGASYGFHYDPATMVHQVGDAYGIATFIGLSSFGMYMVLAAMLITALKAKEI